VSEEAPLVITTLGSTSGLVSGDEVEGLQLKGRGFLGLMTLNSGVMTNRSNTSDNKVPSFSIAGKRPDSNRFTMNGMDYVGNNAGGTYTAPQGISGFLLGVDAVREFNVLGHTYGAEYGKRAGAQVTIVTTSGTNQRSEETRLNSSHRTISYAVFCLKKKKHAQDDEIASATSTLVEGLTNS